MREKRTSTGMTNTPSTLINCLRILLRGTLLIGALAALSGCGTGDVQFKGKIFDAMGMNDSSSKKTPKMVQRSGLVTPPSLEKLPAPGSAPPAQADALASINDPDNVSVENAQDLARRQKAYCDKHYEPGKAAGDASVEGIEGPAGPCRKSAFAAFKNWNKQN